MTTDVMRTKNLNLLGALELIATTTVRACVPVSCVLACLRACVFIHSPHFSGAERICLHWRPHPGRASVFVDVENTTTAQMNSDQGHMTYVLFPNLASE
jgi:hypothetical protein